MAKLLKGILLVCLLMGLVVVAAYAYVTKVVEQPLNIDTPVLFKIEKGQAAGRVINHLQKIKAIDDILMVKVLLKLKPTLAKFKAGTYELTPSMSVIQTLLLFESGKEKLFSISLVEGLRWRDWQAQLKNERHLVFDANTEAKLASLVSDLPNNNIEGWLLPDTYHFSSGTNAFVIISLAYQQMRQFLEAQWYIRALDLPYNSPYESLVMASIIEKETAVPEERPRIAGVFVNRLNLNMRLQTDPTVIYGLGDNFDGDIRRKDLTSPTPYNTYVIKGLPPTPIAMPSKLAITAALNPLATDEIYFVAKGDGSHQFSVSLKEHNQAVNRYQLK